MLYLVIDIGKRNHVASVIDGKGKNLLKGFSFQNNTYGAEKLLERLAQFSPSPIDFIVGMEATGHY